jgi:hypothetical protein
MPITHRSSAAQDITSDCVSWRLGQNEFAARKSAIKNCKAIALRTGFPSDISALQRICR